jgi:hypothetical protein
VKYLHLLLGAEDLTEPDVLPIFVSKVSALLADVEALDVYGTRQGYQVTHQTLGQGHWRVADRQGDQVTHLM